MLQEVAAARNIVIMCGSTIIDGHIFCLGVKSLKISPSASPELHTLPSVIRLIERAGFRPKLTANLSERFSLDIRSLAELIDMFHTRKATDIRDKVFALLGMSSDDPEKSGLQANYETSWEKICQQLVKFVLGKDLFVKALSQTVRIKCKGIIIGRVSSVTGDDRQHIKITSNFEAPNLGDTIQWTLQASAKPIEEHDIICLLYGASKPSIIRLCEDHFAVVVISATLLSRAGRPPFHWTSHVEWPQFSQSKILLLRNFLLVWDWENSYGNIQNKREYKTLTKTFCQASVFSRAEPRRYLEKATRLWNDIAILDDLKEHEKADERLIAAQDEYYLAAFGKMPTSYESGSDCGRTILQFAAGKGHEDIVKLLLDTIHPDIKDRRRGRTPLSFAVNSGHEPIVKLLLITGQVKVDIKNFLNQSPLYWAAGNGYQTIVKLLLANGQVEVDSKDYRHHTPLSWAAENGHEAIVKLLLATGQVEADSKDYHHKTPLFLAAENGHVAVLKLMLASGQVEADSKDHNGYTPLSIAAKNGHAAVVNLLIATGQVEVDSKNHWGQTPLSFAAEHGHTAVVKLLLATGQVKVDSKNYWYKTPLSFAAEHGHTAVLKLLLATGQVETDWEDQYKRIPL